MTSKQRAYLRKLAQPLEPVISIGKAGVTPQLCEAVSESLEARELIKLNILKNCFYDPREVADTIAGRTRSEVVQLIGHKIVLYRAAKKPVIELPK